MKPMCIDQLPEGIKQLAEMRMYEYQDYLTEINVKLPSAYNGDLLTSAFSWSQTPEKYEFWRLVNEGRFEEVMILKTVEQ